MFASFAFQCIILFAQMADPLLHSHFTVLAANRYEWSTTIEDSTGSWLIDMFPFGALAQVLCTVPAHAMQYLAPF